MPPLRRPLKLLSWKVFHTIDRSASKLRVPCGVRALPDSEPVLLQLLSITPSSAAAQRTAGRSEPGWSSPLGPVFLKVRPPAERLSELRATNPKSSEILSLFSKPEEGNNPQRDFCLFVPHSQVMSCDFLFYPRTTFPMMPQDHIFLKLFSI